MQRTRRRRRDGHGKVDRIGPSGTHRVFNDPTGNRKNSHHLAASDHGSAADFLIDWLEDQNSFESVPVVRHGVVHGMQHTPHERVIQELQDEVNHTRTWHGQ